MRSASGAASATFSSPGSDTELNIWAAPNRPTPRATLAPEPAGSKISSAPTGAIMTGRRNLRPNTSVVASIRATLRNTRGLNAISSSAMRLRRIVVSVSVAPTM